MNKKILLLDNYDSFTYNLLHVLRELGEKDIDVIRNDQLTIEDVEPYTHILLSPGPGIPCEAGLLQPIIRAYQNSGKSFLGICLGHQAIAEVFGATLINLDMVHHGIQSQIEILQDDDLFQGISSHPDVGRYHSWVVNPESLPDCIEVTAQSKEKEIMAIRHVNLPIYGVQFHPESVLTPEGKKMIQNWLSL